MNYYSLKLLGLERKLPIVSLSPKLKIASFNLLGDRELINLAARSLVNKVSKIKFDYLVGPELKVVPLLHEMANILKQPRYFVCRKGIMGYMVDPVVSKQKPNLVLDGSDARHLKGKRVVIVDDVVSTGRTIRVLKGLMQEVGAAVEAVATVLRQGNEIDPELTDLISLGNLPLFKS
jgi:adenine phosphoribosyltransferase